MNPSYLDFEQPIAELEAKIEELRLVGNDNQINITEEIEKLRQKSDRLTEKIYSSLTAWQIVKVARHPRRPYTLDYIERIFSGFEELHGDRHFADDNAIVAGIGRLGDTAVMVIGQEKGRGVQEKVRRNFGMPRPEGYRKALRLMELAERFGLPVITLIDTAGAYPGLDAEERGQAEAIARNLLEMSGLRVPIVVAVTGEGGSGGALALGVGDRVLIFEYAVYSVISPEGCAAILWKDQEMKAQAAEAMRITAPDLLKLGVVDEIVAEPPGGVHTDPEAGAARLGDAIERALKALEAMSPEARLEARYRRFRALGVVGGVGAAGGAPAVVPAAPVAPAAPDR